MVLCYLGLGSNVNDRPGMIARATVCLASRGDIVIRKLSRFYLTRPWGEQDQEDFVNAAAEVETHLSPLGLLEAAKAVERGLGRRPTYKWGPREIDIDILFYGAEVVKREDLRIPHPRLRERAFVLVPLAEIAPDLVDPETGVSMAAYLEEIEKGGDTRWTSPTI